MTATNPSSEQQADLTFVRRLFYMVAVAALVGSIYLPLQDTGSGSSDTACKLRLPSAIAWEACSSGTSLHAIVKCRADTPQPACAGWRTR